MPFCVSSTSSKIISKFCGAGLAKVIHVKMKKTHPLSRKSVPPLSAETDFLIFLSLGDLKASDQISSHRPPPELNYGICDHEITYFQLHILHSRVAHK